MRRGWLLAVLGLVAVALAAGVLWVVVGMGSSPEAAPSPTATESEPTPAPSDSPAPDPAATAAPALAAPTCENIMREGFPSGEVADWVPTTSGDPEPVLADGIFCIWSADPEVGTDNVLAYGWAPIDQATWDAFVAERLAEDATWLVEQDERGTYLTHKTDYWIRDDEDYGNTYLFTGDAVLYALTKAETTDVVGPPAA